MSGGASGSFVASLRDFLIGQFDLESLRRLVAELPHGELLTPHLTSPTTLWTMSDEVVGLSVEHEQLADLKEALLERRVQLRTVIDEIWSLPAPEAAGSLAPARPALFPAIPEPPPFLEERPEHDQIRAALRARHPLAGITGLPGSGKTTAAIAALDDDVRSGFGAICWLSSEAGTPMTVQEARRSLVRQLGETSTDAPSREDLAELAAKVLGEGHLLVVLDELKGLLDHLAAVARCHPRTTLLVTTTDTSALLSIGLRDPVRLGGFPPEAGLRVLGRWAGTDGATLPAAARLLAEAIGFHPEGLRILGAIVAGAVDADAEWSYLEGQLLRSRVTALSLPGIPEANLSALVDQIVDSLPGESRALMDALAVSPPGTVVDIGVLAQLSGAPEDECRRIGDLLVRQSLVLVSASRKYGLRELVHLRTRERPGFESRYREALERLRPPRPTVIWSTVMGDTRMALRLAEQMPAAALAESTPELASPLHQAAFHGLAEVVAAILDRGVDPGTLDRQGSDALHYAANTGQLSVVRQLLGRGVSPFRPNDGGADAVTVALHHGHLDAAEMLVEYGARPGSDAPLIRDVHLAVAGGAVAVVRRLLALGAPADPDLGPGNTPLLGLAVSRGYLDVAHLLMERGGASLRPDTLSEALLLAAQAGHVTMVRPLLAAGADVTWTGEAGRTALAQAAVQGHSDIVEQLIGAGAATEHADSAGWRPAHLAAAFQQAEVIAVLHRAGAALGCEGPGGERPLGVSVQRAGLGVQLESSMSIDERGISMAQAVVVTDVDPRAIATVRALLVAGAEVNATDGRGRSALHYAAINLQPALAHELLAAGALRDLRDKDGDSPLDLARAAARDKSGLYLLRADALAKLLEE